jgi:predicted DCC family thiol-disulfide oxidoreductase YuxK
MKHYIVLLSIVLLIVSCSTKREAIGAADEIVVVVSEEDIDSINNTLAQIFSDTIFTPQPEPIYKLNYADPAGFKELKRQSNLIIGSIGTNELKPGTKLVKSLLGEELFNETINGNQQIIFSEDQFGRNQLFMIISGKSASDINNALLEKSELIKSHFDKIFIEKQEKYLFGNDRLKKISKEFKQKYGWEIQIPWGWEVIKELPDSNFVWLGRELPYQWFSINWVNGLIIEDSTMAVEYSNRFPQEYYKTIRYNNYKYQMEQVVFNNWTAWKSVGIWESIEGARGGPFINYTWYDGVTDRTYNLNMLVFIPSRSKATFMRQLDIIAHSFNVK